MIVGSHLCCLMHMSCFDVSVGFEDAYRSPLSVIIVDGIERLVEYVAIGPRFSNVISQTLMVLLKRIPPLGKKLLVLGTISEVGFLDSIGIHESFSVTYHVPTLKIEDARKAAQGGMVFVSVNLPTKERQCIIKSLHWTCRKANSKSRQTMQRLFRALPFCLLSLGVILADDQEVAFLTHATPPTVLHNQGCRGTSLSCSLGVALLKMFQSWWLHKVKVQSQKSKSTENEDELLRLEEQA